MMFRIGVRFHLWVMRKFDHFLEKWDDAFDVPFPGDEEDDDEHR